MHVMFVFAEECFKLLHKDETNRSPLLRDHPQISVLRDKYLEK